MKVVEKMKIHILRSILFFFKEHQGVYEMMWKNAVQPDRPQMAIRRKRAACRLPKTRNTHSEYVIIIAFPLQQWLQERASMLRYTSFAGIGLFFFTKATNFASNHF